MKENRVFLPMYAASAVALATDVPLKNLRNWHDRKDIFYLSDDDREVGEHRRACLADLFIIRLASAFSHWGFPVALAYAESSRIVLQRLAKLRKKSAASERDALDLFFDQYIYVEKAGGGYKVGLREEKFEKGADRVFGAIDQPFSLVAEFAILRPYWFFLEIVEALEE